MEKHIEVKVQQVKYICDYCGKGEMKHTGETLLSYPPQHIHICDNCGRGGRYSCIYPNIEYVPKN